MKIKKKYFPCIKNYPQCICCLKALTQFSDDILYDFNTNKVTPLFV